MTAKRSKTSKGGRVTPKGTRPPSKSAPASAENETETEAETDESRFSIRHAQRQVSLNNRPIGDKKATGARPAGRGQR